MTDDLTRLQLRRKPTAAQPLSGMTILAVEDSRFACEALRLLAMRSGARLRRADCLASARRHLSVYRPTVVLVDLGLPDGSGRELIEELTGAEVSPPIVIGISGDPDGEADALDAGAKGFLGKPIPGLGAFQQAILQHLPQEVLPPGPRIVETDEVTPDYFALKDDLAHAVEALDGDAIDYAVQFVASIAQSARDTGLAEAAQAVARSIAEGAGTEAAVGGLQAAVRSRLSEARAI